LVNGSIGADRLADRQRNLGTAAATLDGGGPIACADWQTGVAFRTFGDELHRVIG
jgi:hypothetical protein